MNAADAIATLLVATGIPDLPFWMTCAPCCLVTFLQARGELNTICRRSSRKSPCGKAAGAASLVVSRPGQPARLNG